jgi:AhpD family alkylhydroperoxidase
MTRLTPAPHGQTPFERLLGHNPLILARWCSLEEALFGSAALSPRLREEVRRSLAVINGCAYCMAKGAPAASHDDAREAAAVAFARLAAQNPSQVPDEAFTDLRRHFTEAQVSELCALVSLLQLEPRCELGG